MSHRRFLTSCDSCGALTSKKYAREHDGRCKLCATGVGSFTCPDCSEKRLTAYQKQHRYHCDACTRMADPTGYASEVGGLY